MKQLLNPWIIVITVRVEDYLANSLVPAISDMS